MQKETLTWFGIPIVMGIGFLLFQIAMDLPTEETTNMLVGLVTLAVLVAIGFAVYRALDTARQHITKPTPAPRKPPPEAPTPKPAIEPPPAPVSAPSASPDNAPAPTMTAQNQPSRSNADERASNKLNIPPKLAIFAAGTLFGCFLFLLLQPFSRSVPTSSYSSPRQKQRDTAERLSVPGEDTETEPRNNALFAAKPPGLAIAPFDAEEARAHQDAWAEHLGLEVEIENSIGMQLRLIPPGEFMMGSPESEEGRYDHEGPRHRVRLTKPFYLGVHPVTQAQWESVMGTNPSWFSEGGHLSDRVSGLSTAGFPVEMVSWYDSQEFIGILNEHSEETGWIYRLPTAAEWEYACRAGTTTRYYFGDDAEDLSEYAWYLGNSGDRPHRVGQKRPNAWGLYDMHGNVYEWCSDWFSTDYYANSPLEDPTGPESGSRRVVRGGSWLNAAGECRSAIWDGSSPGGSGARSFGLGFRVAFSLVAESSDPTPAKSQTGTPPPKETSFDPASSIQYQQEQAALSDAPPLAIAPFDAEEARGVRSSRGFQGVRDGATTLIGPGPRLESMMGEASQYEQLLGSLQYSDHGQAIWDAKQKELLALRDKINRGEMRPTAAAEAMSKWLHGLEHSGIENHIIPEVPLEQRFQQNVIETPYGPAQWDPRQQMFVPFDGGDRGGQAGAGPVTVTGDY